MRLIIYREFFSAYLCTCDKFIAGTPTHIVVARLVTVAGVCRHLSTLSRWACLLLLLGFDVVG